MTETKLNLDSLMVMFDICECKNCVSIKKELWIVKRCRNIESWSDDKEMYIMDNNSVTLSGKTCDTAKCQQGHIVLITWDKANVSKNVWHAFIFHDLKQILFLCKYRPPKEKQITITQVVWLNSCLIICWNIIK